MKKLKIVSISSEISPFSKTGGLADVARSLPKALKRLGHDVICITPFYEKVIDSEKHNLKLIYKNIEVWLNSSESVKVNYWKGYLMPGLSVYFIENKKYFSRRKKLYGSNHENARFLIFDAAALKLISLLKFEADIVHCHDWHTGLIPFYLKTQFRYSKTLAKAKTVFTIHNIIFQMGRNWWEVPPEKKDFGRKRIPHINNPDIEYINFTKRAILSADVISTVSENHMEEIKTKRFGQDLHRILKNREDRLFGIVNGIDYNAYSPEKDEKIFKNYNYQKVHRKQLNKEYVQKLFKLPIRSGVPVFCTTSRVTFQKGFDLITRVVENLMFLDIQMIVIGEGDKEYIKTLKKTARKYPEKLVVVPSHEKNQKYETQVYAGSDFFLLPSTLEPCGINQMIAMRYGCIPIVRRVGGLYDTVENYDPVKETGTGFSFGRDNEFSLYGAIIRAIESKKYKNHWRNLIVRAMRQSNSWEIPAKKYEILYEQTLKMNGEKKKDKKVKRVKQQIKKNNEK